jgi:hypothetical protein
MIVGLGRILVKEQIDDLEDIEKYLRTIGVTYKTNIQNDLAVIYFDTKQVSKLERDSSGYYLGTKRYGIQEIRDLDLQEN